MDKNQKDRIKIKNGEVVIPYVQAYHHILEDSRITGNAFRLLMYLLSKKEGWGFNRKDIRTRLKMGKDALNSAITSLYKHGYLEYKVTPGGTEFTFFTRPDNNPKYINGINDHEKRTIEFTPLLEEIRQKEEEVERKKAAFKQGKQQQKRENKNKNFNNNSIKSVTHTKKNASNVKRKFVRNENVLDSYIEETDLFFED